MDRDGHRMDRDGRIGAPAGRLDAAAAHARFGRLGYDQPRKGLIPIREPGAVETARKCMVTERLGGLLLPPLA